MKIPNYTLPEQGLVIENAFIIIGEERFFNVERNDIPVPFDLATPGEVPRGEDFKPHWYYTANLRVYASEGAYDMFKPHNHTRLVRTKFEGAEKPTQEVIQAFFLEELTK